MIFLKTEKEEDEDSEIILKSNFEKKIGDDKKMSGKFHNFLHQSDHRYVFHYVAASRQRLYRHYSTASDLTDAAAVIIVGWELMLL